MLTQGYGWILWPFFTIELIPASQRGDPLEVSLTMVPQNHPLIPPRNLEAEASGLLDRMLGVFQENIRSVTSQLSSPLQLIGIAMRFLLMLL
jgi:hypothetical protein